MTAAERYAARQQRKLQRAADAYVRARVLPIVVFAPPEWDDLVSQQPIEDLYAYAMNHMSAQYMTWGRVV